MVSRCESWCCAGEIEGDGHSVWIPIHHLDDDVPCYGVLSGYGEEFVRLGVGDEQMAIEKTLHRVGTDIEPDIVPAAGDDGVLQRDGAREIADLVAVRYFFKDGDLVDPGAEMHPVEGIAVLYGEGDDEGIVAVEFLCFQLQGV